MARGLRRAGRRRPQDLESRRTGAISGLEVHGGPGLPPPEPADGTPAGTTPHRPDPRDHLDRLARLDRPDRPARPDHLEASGGRGLEHRLAAWWRGLGRARRAGLALAAVAAAALLLVRTLPGPAPPAPPPVATFWPAEHAVVHYQGTEPSHDPSLRRSSYVISIENADVADMMVTQVAQPYRGLTLSEYPALPVVVHPGQTVLIQITASAVDCTQIPTDDNLPYLDLTLRNSQAIQTESEILAAPYPRDLHQAMAAACHRGPSLK